MLPTVKLLSRLMLGLSMLLLSVPGVAAINAQALQQLELDIWSVRSGYYLYSVMEGDKAYEAVLADKITAAERSFNTLKGNAEGSDDEALVNALEDHFHNFIELANENTIAELGYTDTHLAIDLNNQAAEIIQLLKEHKGEGDPNDLLALAIQSQRMTSEYLSLAAAPDGGTSAADGEIRIDFDEAVPEFDELLATLQQKYTDDDAVSRALLQVDRKWRFIRESMVKFYEDAVPFLVSRYSEQIVELIEQVVE